MPQFCTVFYKESLFFSFCSCCTFLETPLLLSLPVLCELLAVIDSFDELHGCRELHPPVGLLSRQTVGIETADVLHSGQQARGVCLGWEKREIQLVCKAQYLQTPPDTEQKHNSLCAVILILPAG